MIENLSFAHWLVVVSACISMLGAYAYIRDTVAGRSKPNRVSWCMWATAPLLGTLVALSSGADPWATARVFLSGLIPLLVFLVSFINPNSYWKITKFDLWCGAFAVVGLVFWLVAGSPDIAILSLVIADVLAALPTIKKAWTNPETETGITYIASFASALLVIPSIPIWNIENSAFQIYLLLANGILVFCVYRKRLKLFT